MRRKDSICRLMPVVISVRTVLLSRIVTASFGAALYMTTIILLYYNTILASLAFKIVRALVAVESHMRCLARPADIFATWPTTAASDCYLRCSSEAVSSLGKIRRTKENWHPSLPIAVTPFIPSPSDTIA
jgi:hypothetical protein